MTFGSLNFQSSEVLMAKSSPQLGLFWIYRRRVIAFTVPFDTIRSIAGSTDTDLAHANLWKEVVGQRPELDGREYWSIPRGRVLFQKTFVIYASSSIISDTKLVEQVVRRFPPFRAEGTDTGRPAL